MIRPRVVLNKSLTDCLRSTSIMHVQAMLIARASCVDIARVTESHDSILKSNMSESLQYII